MELSLSLGDSTKSNGFLLKNRETSSIPTKTLGLCMALGIGSNRNQEEEREKENLDADDESDEVLKRSSGEPPVQLDLFSLAPVHGSSDNGSSEGVSSEKLGFPAARGSDVNRLSAAAEEGAAPAVSSPNSAASSFRMDFGVFRCGNKRDSDFAGNDAVEAERASSRASDDDENGLARKKLRLSKEQSAYLEESFKEHNTLNPKQKQSLAKQLGLRPRQVEVWFQNRRARTKLKQTEVDCEYLKRCCETLTEENRRLHKELQELRALKTSNPFQMQLPATTLTMCPSCERVATTSTTTSAATAAPPAAAAATTNTTSKATPFPVSRKRVLPFFQTQFHPHQSAAS